MGPPQNTVKVTMPDVPALKLGDMHLPPAPKAGTFRHQSTRDNLRQTKQTLRQHTSRESRDLLLTYRADRERALAQQMLQSAKGDDKNMDGATADVVRRLLAAARNAQLPSEKARIVRELFSRRLYRQCRSLATQIASEPSYTGGDVHEVLGDLACQRQEYDEAVGHYSAALQGDPLLVSAYYSRALCHLTLKSFKKSLADLNKFLGLEPNVSSTPYIKIAQCYSGLQQYEDALQAYNTALKLDPRRASLYFQRASLLERLGRSEDAKKDYDMILEIEPDFHKQHMDRAAKHYRRQEYKAAAKIYTSLLKFLPGKHDILRARAKCLSHLDDPVGHLQAITDFTTCIDADVNGDTGDPHLRLERAYCLHRCLGRHLEALIDYSAYLQHHHDDQAAVRDSLECYEAQGGKGNLEKVIHGKKHLLELNDDGGTAGIDLVVDIIHFLVKYHNELDENWERCHQWLLALWSRGKTIRQAPLRHHLPTETMACLHGRMSQAGHHWPIRTIAQEEEEVPYSIPSLQLLALESAALTPGRIPAVSEYSVVQEELESFAMNRAEAATAESVIQAWREENADPKAKGKKKDSKATSKGGTKGKSSKGGKGGKKS